MKQSWDVIVVGGGGSGLTTAVSAAENGCTVLVLEKQLVLGGTTGMAVGSFTANRTGLQAAAGVADTLQAHLEDVAKFAPPEIEARNNSELRSMFLANAGETLTWLQGIGLSFFGPSPEPPNRVPRMHNVIPGARAYIFALQKRLQQLGGQIKCGASVISLIQQAGRVTGVRVAVGTERREFYAKRGVVLAAGDYANSRELIAEYKGKQFAAIEGINTNALGDGQRLARSVGARLINMDVTYGPEIRFNPPKTTMQQRLPTAAPVTKALAAVVPNLPQFLLNAFIKRLLVVWQHPDEALFKDGAILINSQGERFCNELESPGREIAIAEQTGKQAFILLDERLCKRYSRWPHFISTAPRIAYAYVADYQRLRPDVTCGTTTLREMAERRNLNAVLVERTIAEYNRAVGAGDTDRFGRAERHPLGGRRWMLLGPAKAYFTTTEGSPAVTNRLEVLSEAGEVIPGLYAVGQNGIGGQILWGHGLKIGWAMTSGRLLGQWLAGTLVEARGDGAVGVCNPKE